MADRKRTTRDTPLRLKTLPRRWGYFVGALLVVASTVLGYLAHPLLTATNAVMLYLLCVVVTAVLGGLGPSIMTCVLSVLAHDYFFLAPLLSFGPPDVHDIPTLVVLLAVGATISYLASRVRSQTEASQRRERETFALYALSRDLAVSTDLESHISAILNKTKATFGCETAVFLADDQGRDPLSPHIEDGSFVVNDIERAAAVWSFQNRRVAGHGTDIHGEAKARYFPLVTARGAVGVMALKTSDLATELTDEQRQLLGAYAGLAAVAIEGSMSAEEARSIKLSQEAVERLQTALLDSISHDLRTPLASVIGATSSLREESVDLDSTARQNLVEVAYDEAQRLDSLITNLLDMSRLEAGAIRISRQPVEIQELVGAALEQLGVRSHTHPIKTDIPEDLPIVSVDSGLVVQMLVNILDNALKYSPAGSPIEINARPVDHQIEVAVADCGSGIPPQHLPYVFRRFYRVPHSSVPSTGLGLAICKGIAEAHHGSITAENRPGGGTIIRVRLLVEEDFSGSAR